MDRPVASPREIQKALQLTRPFWQELSERHEGIEDAAQEIARTPFLQLMNKGAVESVEQLLYDFRTAVALRVTGLITEDEILAFDQVDGLLHLYQAMVMTARALRERTHYYNPDQLVLQARVSTFGGALTLLAKEMRDPTQCLMSVLTRLELSPERRLQMFDSIMAHTNDSRQAIVLH